MTNRIIGTEEQNAQFDINKVNNGGGYHQPSYDFIIDGEQGVFSDTSCGDFGSRYSVAWKSVEGYFGSMVSDQAYLVGSSEDLEALDKGLQELDIFDNLSMYIEQLKDS